MPLNSTQHYSHTELTDFCETFLLIFNCCWRKKGGKSYTPGISPFSIFAVRLTKKAIEVRRGEKKNTTPPNLLIINNGDGKKTDVFPVHQQCLNCQSEISAEAFIKAT